MTRQHDMNGTPPGAVTAALSFLSAASEKPVTYVSAPGTRGPAQYRRTGTYEDHQVTILDGRAMKPMLERQGFQLFQVSSHAGDDVAAYYAETERLLMAATGAKRALTFDHTLRRVGGATDGVRDAVHVVHVDYTPTSAATRLRDLAGAETEALQRRRHVIVNTWRPISGPVRMSPLALCDATSLQAADLVTMELRYPDRVGENYHVRFGAHQRWAWFPSMAQDEILLFKCFDSAAGGRAGCVPHTAFHLPDTPAGTPPRQSIETRTFLFF